MKSRSVELAVGAFVILFGLALFMLAMNVSGLAGGTIRDGYTLTAKFDNISGLKKRAKVTIAGVKVGQVEDIGFDPVTGKALVTLKMDKKLTTFNNEQLKEVQKFALEDLKLSYDYEQANPEQQKAMEQQLASKMTNITSIDTDAYIKVATNGIIGEKYLKIDLGGGAGYLPLGGSFPETQTQGTVEIEDLVSKFVSNSGNSSKADNNASPSTPAPQADATASKASPASKPVAAEQPAMDEENLFKE